MNTLFKVEIISLVFVPYCSSDVYSGTKAASADTGNLVFHGEIIVDNNLSVNEIMENESLFHDTMCQQSGVK